jgi:protein-S-isoprenylcysteine O-methyltransferase Ste14
MKKIMPTTFLLGAVVATAALHFVLPGRQLLASPWRFIGLLPLAAGTALNLLADRAFRQYETTVKPFEESSALVTGGVFRITRNPMYLGMTLILLGIAALLGSAAAFAMVPVFAVLLDRIYIVPEEVMLEEAFDDEFREYRNRVRRWI